jgi:hypothetical protein
VRRTSATGLPLVSNACTHTCVRLPGATGTLIDPELLAVRDVTSEASACCQRTKTRCAGTVAVHAMRTRPVTFPDFGVTVSREAMAGSPALGVADVEPGDLSDVPIRLVAVTTTE